MSPKVQGENLNDPLPEAPEQDQALIEASLSMTTQATTAPKSGGTGSIKVTG